MKKLIEPKGFRVPVLIDREMYDTFKAYSELTGVPVVRLVREALSDFQESSLQVRLEALTKKTLDSQTLTPLNSLPEIEKFDS